MVTWKEIGFGLGCGCLWWALAAATDWSLTRTALVYGFGMAGVFLVWSCRGIDER